MRVAPGEVSQLEEVLASNQAILGWAKLEGVHHAGVTQAEIKAQLRHHADYYANGEASIAQAAGSIYRFLHEIKAGDYLLIPDEKDFYIAKAVGEGPVYLADKVAEDSAYRWNIEFLNDKQPIFRKNAPDNIQTALGHRQTVTSANNCLEDIPLVLSQNLLLNFRKNAYEFYHQQTLQVLCSPDLQLLHLKGMIADLLPKGSILPGDLEVYQKTSDIIWTTHDIFDDFSLNLIIKILPNRADSPIDVDELHQILEEIQTQIKELRVEEFADTPIILMVITTGEFTESCRQEEKSLAQDKFLAIKLIDREQFAKAYSEYLKATLSRRYPNLKYFK
ncbi:Uncharacterised protein [Suttonella ornithocola]|uniref:Uncharacterized protein n=1 Tax=Suttonella ornithocola TaxID=279832 RepID=A0A380RAM0_9GAMM|nr:Uncharacterised protein [Suttonella ornithocola]SUQ09727.1 Uncharacterised protein [Suttonella ornithocola]